MTQLTPLHDVHRRLGGTLTDFAGWSMPLRYGSDITEHHAVRQAAGIFDLCHMGEIFVEGEDAGRALDHALVSRPSAMGIGKARYSMLCDVDGGIVDDLVVYRLAADRFLVVANAANAAVVATEMTERTADFDVLVRDDSASWGLIAVQGPSSAAIVAEVIEADVQALRYYAVDPASVGGLDVLLARTGYTGEDGFEIFCPPSAAADIWELLSVAGRSHGLVPAGLACRDSLRLEAGMPLHGHELSTSVTPFHAGLGRIVDFEKPDGFIGDQALRELSRGEPRRVLVGLVGTERRSPRPGCSVISPADREVVGEVTSGMPSPTLGVPIAMAYVSSGLSAPGTTLGVEVRGQSIDADVVPLPFYTRSR